MFSHRHLDGCRRANSLIKNIMENEITAEIITPDGNVAVPASLEDGTITVDLSEVKIEELI